MLINEILIEMSSVTRRKSGKFPFYNGGPGVYGNVLHYLDDVVVYPDYRDEYSDRDSKEDPYRYPKKARAGVVGPAAFNRATPVGNQAFNQALNDLKRHAQSRGAKLIIMNKDDSKSAGAIVAREFANERDEKFYFAKFLSDNLGAYAGGHDSENAQLNRWDNNYFERIGYINSQGNRFGKHNNQQHLKPLFARALKTGNWDELEQARAGITGVEAGERDSYGPKGVLSKMDNLTNKDIVDQIGKKFGQSNPDLVALAEMASIPGTTVYPAPNNISYSTFSKSFCEILHPMAVVTGNLKLDGITKSLAAARITFPTSNSEPLSDSYLKTGGDTILLSSKAGTGTRSSLGGIKSYLEQTKLTPQEQQYYALEVRALRTIAQKAQKPNP